MNEKNKGGTIKLDGKEKIFEEGMIVSGPEKKALSVARAIVDTAVIVDSVSNLNNAAVMMQKDIEKSGSEKEVSVGGTASATGEALLSYYKSPIVEAIKEAEVVVLFAPSKNKDSAIARHIKKLIKQDEDYSGDKELQNGEKLGMNGADPDKITDNINPNPEAKKEPQKTPDVLIPEDDEGPNEVVPRAKLETPVSEYETYEPVLPAGLSGEWYKWIDSLKALGSSARKGIFNKYLKLKYSFTEYSPTSGKSVIIYADDLLMNAAVYDLQSTIKNIFVEHDILKGGKIILFARDPANLEIVKELINQAGLNNDSIVSVLENENISKKGDFSETKMLLRKARQIGAIDGENELLAVIRGPLRGKWNKDKKLEALLKDNELPLIIIGPEKGVYSFAGAIHAALKVKLSEEKNRIWLIMLPPIRSLTEDIKSLYAGYKRALKALQSA